jgi:glyoxylase I family protein
MLDKLHHVAFRCANALVTVDFYTRILGLGFAHTIINEIVPSINLKCPHVHIFFELRDGSYIAFFEVPGLEPAQKDPNTPIWVKHLALEVSDLAALQIAKTRLEDNGVEVIGFVDHHVFQSIYFFDPDGHRLEITARTVGPGDLSRHREEAMPLLMKWQERKAIGSLS